MLWILEDFSGYTLKEDYELLNCNIIVRIVGVIELLIECMKKCVNVEGSHLDSVTIKGMSLFN